MRNFPGPSFLDAMSSKDIFIFSSGGHFVGVEPFVQFY